MDLIQGEQLLLAISGSHKGQRECAPKGHLEVTENGVHYKTPMFGILKVQLIKGVVHNLVKSKTLMPWACE